MIARSLVTTGSLFVYPEMHRTPLATLGQLEHPFPNHAAQNLIRPRTCPHFASDSSTLPGEHAFALQCLDLIGRIRQIVSQNIRVVFS